MNEEWAAYEGVRHLWSCPNCGYINQEEEDVRGSHVECDDCGWEGECEP